MAYLFQHRKNMILSNPFELASLNGTNGLIFEGIDSGDQLGVSVSGAGDFNNDGIDDITIGAISADPNASTDGGEVYIVFGKTGTFGLNFDLSTLDGSNGLILNGIDVLDRAGGVVSSAGDINNDGISDVIIGARNADPNGNFGAGETYVVFGDDSSLSGSLDLSSLNGNNGFVINGIDSDDFSGESISSAGDINNDGIDDLIIGAFGAVANGNSFAGESYVVFGTNSGFNSSLNLSSLNGANGFTINGINEGDNSGSSVSGAGDVNNDGIDDIIIGARNADSNGNSDAGESYVVFGTNSGFASSFDLSSLNGTNGFAIAGIDAFDRSGSYVSGAGDINNDGIDDIVIGAIQGDPNGNVNAGETYVIFGKSTGFSSSFDPSSLDGTNGFTINGINPGDNSGFSVDQAGDVNNDGIDDIIIGTAIFPENNNTPPSSSYLVFGKAGGFDAVLDLASLNLNDGIVFEGIDNGDIAGFSVGGAGDFNNDGISDVIIGARGADPNGNNSGESYVVFGSDRFAPQIITDNEINTPENRRFVIDINSVDDDDTESSGLNYSISGGDDAALFSLNRNIGRLNFQTAPNFEMPTDANNNNEYLIQITVTDSEGLTDVQDLIVNVTDQGEDGNNVLMGTPGNDLIAGGIGNDIIRGIAGDDTLNGNADDDFLVGNSGTDRIDGGAGNDTLNGGEDNDTLIGRSGSDRLVGAGGSDVLNGGVDNDTLNGGNGNDTLNSGAGNDILIGGNESDRLIGNIGNDVLNGGDDNDTLQGGNDNDTLRGDGGDDFLVGGQGNDLFITTSGEGSDRIRDFVIGTDLIGLTDGLSFNDLSFVGSRIELGSETLLILNGINTNTLTSSDFIST